MKIAFFTDTFCPTFNGVVSAIIHMANGLTEAGHQVLIIAPRNGHVDRFAWGLNPNIETYLLPSIDSKIYPDIRIGVPTPKLLEIVKKFNPDIIHTFTPVLGTQGVILGKHLGVPLVGSHLTNFFDREMLKALGKPTNRLAMTAQDSIRPLLKTFFNRHNVVHVPTHSTKKEIKKLGVTRTIKVIPVPVPYAELQAAEEVGRLKKTQLGINQALLYSGRMSGEKNLNLLIEVFFDLKLIHPELKLVLIGDGKERHTLFEQASKLGVNESIIWTGALTHKKVVEDGYYYLGDVFVILSDTETQGLATVEAMACGLPVVGARALATKEVIGKNGLIVSSGNHKQIVAAVNSILEDRELAGKFSELSKERAQNFSSTVVIKSMLSLYQSLL